MDYTKLSVRLLLPSVAKKMFRANMVCMTTCITPQILQRWDSEALKAIDGVMGLVEDAEYLLRLPGSWRCQRC